MKFVEGTVLADEVKALIRGAPNVIIATAFVGDGFDTLIETRPAHFPPVDLRCNLHMGGTNPQPLQKLLGLSTARIRLTSCPRLHAKVIVGGDTAIVSSANLSRYGVGSMGYTQITFGPAHQEAGVVLTDSNEINAIRKWIDTLSGRLISSANDRELIEAKKLFALNHRWSRPYPPLSQPHNAEETVLRILLDPVNELNVRRAQVVICRADASEVAIQTVAQVRLEGYPIGIEDFFEDFKLFPSDAVLLYFEGFKRSNRVKFRGCYLPRQDKSAVRPHPTNGVKHWLQFVEPFRVRWISNDTTTTRQFNTLVEDYLENSNQESGSLQFALCDLVQYLKDRAGGVPRSVRKQRVVSNEFTTDRAVV